MAPTVQPDVTPSPAGRQPSPVRAALLICLGWYTLMALAFAGYVARLPDAVDQCGPLCLSPRNGFLVMSVVHGLPVLVGCILVSLAVVASLRRRITSGAALGTLAAAVPVLLLAPVILFAHG
ncbi:MAG TPA: hypothetical protein VGD43_10980 [Micromonospora sp.]